jgi:KDO2-lipid IV(A) lauroyltransferase
MDKEYIQYLAAGIVSSVLPRPFAYWIGRRIAEVVYRRDEKGRRAVQANLRHILAYKGLHAGDAVLNAMAVETFRSFGKYLVDFFRFRSVTSDQVERLVVTEHPKYVASVRAREGGVLLATAHVGNWEFGGALLASMGCPMNVVVLPQSSARTERLFRRRREQRGFNVIPLEHAVSGCLRALARREFVALLIDRDYSRNGEAVEFCGRPARFPRGVATFSVRTGCPILQGHLLRQPDETFLMKWESPVDPVEQGSVRAVQSLLCARLESIVCEYPTQWFMFEPFWEDA